MKTNEANLLERLENWSPDAANAEFPFSKRLARDNEWSLFYAQRVIREYKRFLFLAMAAGHPVTPSDQVDQAWHLHLLYTESYWGELCPKILGKPLHHGPTKGGSAEREKFGDWYGRTLASYRDFFGEEAPADIWPGHAQRFGEDIQFARVNLARNWTIPKPRWFLAMNRGWLAWLGRTAMALVFGLVMAGCTREFVWKGENLELPGSVFDFRGGSFLLFFIGLWTVAGGLAYWLRQRARGLVGLVKPVPKLDAYQAAYLAGGRNRAVFAAVAKLAKEGSLSVGEKESRIEWRELQPGPHHPFEVLVHGRVAPSGCSFRDVVKSVESEPEGNAIEEWLRESGLLTRVGDYPWLSLFPSLIALVPTVFGAIKISIAVQRDRPFGILLMLTIVSFVVAMALLVRPRRTRRGEEALEALKHEHREMEGGSFFGEADRGLPMAVALFGAVALSGTGLADLEQKLRANSGAADGGGYGGGCGAGGCGGGGGGCGGGGCGGCGGG